MVARARDVVAMVEGDIRSGLETREFRRRSKWLFTTASTKDVQWRVAFGTKWWAKDETFTVFPYVGIRYEPAQRILDQILDTPRASWSPTLNRPLYMLIPERVESLVGEWFFPVGVDEIVEVVEDLMERLDEFGVPFMRRFSDPGRLIEGLEQDLDTTGWGSLKLPVLYAVRGHRERARDYLEQGFLSREGKDDAAARRFREKGKLIVQWLDAQDKV